MIFSKLKSYALVVGAGVLTVLVSLVAVLKSQRDRYKRNADVYKAQYKQRDAEMKSDNEVDQEYSRRAQEVKKDLDEGKIPSNLSDPDK